MVGADDLTAQLVADQHFAVADAEDWQSEPEHQFRRPGRLLAINRGRTAGQDDRGRPEGADPFLAHIERQDLAVDTAFPNPAGDQLCDLAAEIQDQDPFVIDIAGRS